MANFRSGKIQNSSLPDVLESCRRQKATGTLTVRSNDIVKCIFLSEGQIVFASSTSAQDRLGEILVQSGKLTQKNLDYALGLYNKGARLKKLGAILVENGLMNPKDLFSGLKAQVNNIIYSLFLWTEGEYSFQDSLPPDMIHLQIDFEELLSEIIQRIKQEA